MDMQVVNDDKLFRGEGESLCLLYYNSMIVALPHRSVEGATGFRDERECD